LNIRELVGVSLWFFNFRKLLKSINIPGWFVLAEAGDDSVLGSKAGELLAKRRIARWHR
jgi:hypothetical protein